MNIEKKLIELSSLLDKLNLDFEDPKINFGTEFFYSKDLLKWILMSCEDLTSISLKNIVQNERFFEELKIIFQSLHFREAHKRVKIIEEICQLVKNGFYAGAITLLYGQFEGLLTDFLIHQKKLRYESNRLIYNDKNFQYRDKKNRLRDFIDNKKGKRCNEKMIVGLADNILIAQYFFKDFEKLHIYTIDEHGSTISDSRNKILHGTDLDNFTLERAFILAMWFYVVCNWMSNKK